ncbi:ABC transporter ATP-binding protein [Candidatus Galacturonibacter soehngenii]|uniref:ABC transporter ATP-binding protein n=1 Tax=Candidatus Galacturonatibacter soehngenii TaxID=2307010 RepID=A0A7V7QNZ4_9FIRM|nr:ABC transporter ATP-binding protein [Candidatus Galacturonibacter soehngenii]KAB1441021.1 ABC transporter ATP-binding protein [Candidatus Galacturonibacter soehngenii]
MIEVKNLVKRYGDNIAVDHLNFTVEKGQIYGFLGPNGAGKSTTMNIITGYIAASDGEVIINGHNIFEEPELAKKSIGYLPEIPPLYVDMTPYEYLKFAAELKKIEKKERKQMIDEVMKLTKITDVSNRLIKNLSKGYKQRVGLAQAILGYPEVIILDEPTVGLDPKQIIEIRDLIKSLSKKHTVILSSHILSEVSAVCDHVMILSKGKLVASDKPEELSKLMVGSNTLELTIKEEEAKVREILNEMTEIIEFSIHSSVEEDAVDITLKTKQQIDIREKIFYEMAKEKCPILAMKVSNMSLEDVFLELTATDKEVRQSQLILENQSIESKQNEEEQEDDSNL